MLNRGALHNCALAPQRCAQNLAQLDTDGPLVECHTKMTSELSGQNTPHVADGRSMPLSVLLAGGCNLVLNAFRPHHFQYLAHVNALLVMKIPSRLPQRLRSWSTASSITDHLKTIACGDTPKNSNCQFNPPMDETETSSPEKLCMIA